LINPEDSFFACLNPACDVVYINTNAQAVFHGHVLKEPVEIHGRIHLVVTSTALGMGAISVNYLLNVAAIVALLMVKATGTTLKQARLIALGLLVGSLLLALKTVGVLKYIDMSILYLPGFAIILYGLFRYELMSVSPIARNKAFEVIEEGIVVSSSLW